MFARLFLAFAMLVIAPLTDARERRIATPGPQSIVGHLDAAKAPQTRGEGRPTIAAKS